MEEYIGTKLIYAEPMTRGEYNKYRGWTIPENENPDDEGYIVKYSDNYIAWSPKAAFEESYKPTTGMTFGLAIEAIKKLGRRVARKGWNGQDMYLFYVSGADYYMLKNTDMLCGADRMDWIAIAINHKMFGPWIPSQTDMLADDWYIIE